MATTRTYVIHITLTGEGDLPTTPADVSNDAGPGALEEIISSGITPVLDQHFIEIESMYVYDGVSHS